MKILRISSRFHPPHPWLRDPARVDLMSKYHAVGGMQLQVYLLTKTLSDLGIHQEVITVKPPWTEALESWDNVKVHRYGLQVPARRQLYEIPAFMGTLKIASHPFDIVHCHSAEDIAAIPLGIIAARRANAPLVLTIHNSWNFTYQSIDSNPSVRSVLGSFVERIGLMKAKRILVLTNRTAKLLVHQMHIDSKKIEIVPDGVDLALFASPIRPETLGYFAKRYGILGPDRKIAYVGRLNMQKGVAYLLQAISLLRARGRRTKLIICGDGPEYKSLRKKCIELGIQEDITFTRSVHHDDIPLIFELVEVVVVPSIYEELGSVLLEAMAASKAVIASNVGGISEIIQHLENGILVPPKDAFSLADQISMLMDDRSLSLRLGQQAFHSSKKYDIVKLARQTHGIYLSLMKGDKS